MDSMLDPPEEVAEALAPFSIAVEIGIRRAGPSVNVNQQKKSVSRATWKSAAVPEQLQGVRAQAAYRWILERNATYAHYIAEHQPVQEAVSKDASAPLYLGPRACSLCRRGSRSLLDRCCMRLLALVTETTGRGWRRWAVWLARASVARESRIGTSWHAVPPTMAWTSSWLACCMMLLWRGRS